MTIKILEEKIIELSVNPRDISHASYILKEKDNDIIILKKKLKILTIQPMEYLKLRKEHEENESSYATIIHFQLLVDDIGDGINEINLHFIALKIQKTCISTMKVTQGIYSTVQ